MTSPLNHGVGTIQSENVSLCLGAWIKIPLDLLPFSLSPALIRLISLSK